MRINLFVASATGKSRRAADKLIESSKVTINGNVAKPGDQVEPTDSVLVDGKTINIPEQQQTIMLNKPVGYVSSRDGQGSKTIYDLMPTELHQLKPVGRLDKDSSGLLLMTTDGQLAHQLTHPSFKKRKVYLITIDKALVDADRITIEAGVKLEDGISKFQLVGTGKDWTVTMSEGRNRQIRRTFAAVGYKVTNLHRIQFGDYKLGDLTDGKYLPIS